MKEQGLTMVNNTPVVETERLFLRLFNDGDLNAAYNLFSDTEVQKYLSPKNRRTREQLKVSLKKFAGHWAERGFGVFCITKKEKDEMIGYCGFQYFDGTEDVEIIFAVRKEDWQNGFATEAATECLKFGFENLNFDKVYAATDPQNFASKAVIKKLGMKYDEITNHYEMKLAVFCVTREAFRSLNK